MKILHCSDLHLGRRPAGGVGEYSESRFNDYFDSFRHIADYALAKAVETVIIPGDIFDRREITPGILERAEQIFSRLKEAGISTIISEGNHDRGGSNDSTWLDYLVHRQLVLMPSVIADEKNGYKFEPVILNGIHFYSMGYPGIYVEDISRSLAELLDPGKVNIILVHTAVSPGGHFPGTVTPEVIDMFKGKAFYIAGGHFHSYHQYPADEPYFFVPGSPEYWDIGEKDEKFFIVFDSDSGKRDKIDSRRRERIEQNHSFASKSDKDFSGEFDNWLSSISIHDSSVVVCNFRVDDNLYPDGAACEKKIESAGALKAKVNFIYNRSWRDNGFNDEQIFSTESIEMENLVSSGYPDVSAEKIVRTYLPELKKLQAEEQPAESAFDLLDRMIEEVAGGI